MILLLIFFYITEPVVDMRQEPSQNSPVVSQALIGEEIQIEKKEKDWCFITTSDSYHGWILSSSIISREDPYAPSLKVFRPSAHLYATPSMYLGPIFTVPYGTLLETVEEVNQEWIHVLLPNKTSCYIRRGDITPSFLIQEKEDLVPFSYLFLNLPYTWGGRSSFGFDCSGFIQMLYKEIGCSLPRDAHQQINAPHLLAIPLEDIQPGDLIFFGASSEEITHVGMYMGENQFIHASIKENKPWLRISSLSDFEWSGAPLSERPYRAVRR